MVLGAALPFAIGLAVFGPDVHRTWLEQLRGIEWIWTPWSASVHGVIMRGYTGNMVVPAARLPPIVSGLAWLLGSAILAASLWRVRHDDVDRAFGLLWVSSLLAFPLGWIYYGWFAFAPVFSLHVSGRLWQPAGTHALWMLVYPPALLWMGTERIWSLTGASIYFWATLTLWLAIWRNRTADTPVGFPAGRDD